MARRRRGHHLDRKKKPKKLSLPTEIITEILEISAWSSSAIQHARNVCLVDRRAHKQCWPALHRTVALRDDVQLKRFSQYFSKTREGETAQQLEIRQNALQSLYLNNTKQDESVKAFNSFETILHGAKNLKMCHFEEHWCYNNQWMQRNEKANRLIWNPLKLLASFPKDVVPSDHPRFAHLPPIEERSPQDWVNLVPKLQELTLSAHTISSKHLIALDQKHWGSDSCRVVPEAKRLEANMSAFDNLARLHLYFANLDMPESPLLEVLLSLPMLTHLRLSRPITHFANSSSYENDSDGEFYLLVNTDLSEAVQRLLEDRHTSCVAMESIIIQGGEKTSTRVMEKLRYMEMHEDYCKDRLHILHHTNDASRRLAFWHDCEDDGGLANLKSDLYDEIEAKIEAQEAEYYKHDGDGFDSEDWDKEYDSEGDVIALKLKKVEEQGRVEGSRADAILNTKEDTDRKCERLGFSHFSKRVNGEEGVWSTKCSSLWY